MFGLGPVRYFGIDIGESAIKMVEVRKTRDGFRLSKATIIELNIDPTLDDREKREKIVQENLRKLLAKEGISYGTVALSISGQSVFIRPLKVPKIAKNKIEQIIQYEAQLQVPFPINQVIWDYEFFETHESPEAEVTLVAVKKDIIEERINLIKGTNLEVESIEVNSFALFNALDFVENVKNKIILDIGARITDIIIVEENKIWTRSILIGGNDLTKAIASNLNISFAEAEELKKKEGIVAISDEDRNISPNASVISDAITPVLVDLQTDISKSIGYYKSQYDETRMFREVIITGGCSKLKNLAAFISGNIDIPAQVIDILDKIRADLDFELTKDFVNRMDVAIGLALRTVTPLFTRTNLTPKEILQAKEFGKKKWHIVGSLCVALLISLTLINFLNWSNRRERTALIRSQAMIERYSEFQKEIAGRRDEIYDLKRRLDFAVELFNNRTKAIKTLSVLGKSLPDDVWLIGIKNDKNTITIGGRVKGNFESITSFKNELIKSGYFKSVVVESANVLKESNLTEDVRVFTIKIEI